MAGTVNTPLVVPQRTGTVIDVERFPRAYMEGCDNPRPAYPQIAEPDR